MTVSRIKLALGFVLALVAFIVLLFPFVSVSTPPDPFTQLLTLGVVTVVTIPIAVVFVRRSQSLERLYGFVLATYALAFIVIFPVFGVLFAIDAMPAVTIQQSGFGWAVAQSISLFFVYVLAFHLVYRGGYTRLKTRLA